MKTASLPSLRVDPELRAGAESVLQDGETLSSFIETAVRDEIRARRVNAEFIARGLASREEAKASGEYYQAEDVMHELEDMLAAAKTGHAS
jgi:predicted transcriptional regulator